MRLEKPVLVLTLGLVLSVEGLWDSLPKWGKCPQLEAQQSFVPRLMNGVWYEQAGYQTNRINRLGGNNRCVTAEYTYDDVKTGLISVVNKGVDNDSKRLVTVTGTAKLDDPLSEEGKLTTTMHSGWFHKQKGPYWVLSTDYSTYSVVYSCTNFLYFWRYESVWELSRVQWFTTGPEMYAFFGNTTAAIRNHNLSPLLSYITPSKQDNCT